MIHHYKNPSIKFMVNKQNFNKLLGILTFQEKNFVEDEWKEKVTNLQDMLLKYSIPQKDEDGDVAIIDIALYPQEASELIVILLSAFEAIDIDKDYTELMKRK